MKKWTMLILVLFSILILNACKKSTTSSTTGHTTATTDTVVAPSRANSEAAFEKAISSEGYWMVIVERDLTFTKDLTVNGNMTKPGKEGYTRSLAFATYDQEGKLANRYTVTVPNITINSQNTLLEYGILKGDVYITATGFKTKDAKIDGNLYFASEELMNAFQKDATTVITGVTAVKTK